VKSFADLNNAVLKCKNGEQLTVSVISSQYLKLYFINSGGSLTGRIAKWSEIGSIWQSCCQINKMLFRISFKLTNMYFHILANILLFFGMLWGCVGMYSRKEGGIHGLAVQFHPAKQYHPYWEPLAGVASSRNDSTKQII